VTSQEVVEQAVDEIVDRYGHEILQSPRQLHAVLADLVGTPDRVDHALWVRAVATAAAALGDEPERALSPDRFDVLAAGVADDTGIDTHVARWACAVVARVTGRAPRRGSPTREPRLPVAAIGATLALVAVAVVWLWSRAPASEPDPDPTSRPTTMRSQPADGDVAGGDDATAQPGDTNVAELPLTTVAVDTIDLARTWRLTNAAFEGRLEATGRDDADAAATTVHREPVPLAAVDLAGPDVTLDDFRFDDVAATSYDSGVLTYRIAPAAGESVVLDYELQLAQSPDPTVELLRSWWQQWSQDAAPLLGEVPRPTA
jgi:hypothetical protein